MAKERLIITQGLCDKVKKLATHGMEQKEIADMLGISTATIGRIKAAGYDEKLFRLKNEKRSQAEKQKKIMDRHMQEIMEQDRKDIEAAIKRRDKLFGIKTSDPGRGEHMAAQVPGQLEMDLPEKKEPAEGQQKMFKFLEGKFDEVEKEEIAICGKLDKIYDMLGQILRAIRKE